jgi:XRE family transcriptional regulator, aerobic/anaerobic benzoate catabolism transcriptional regulator
MASTSRPRASSIRAARANYDSDPLKLLGNRVRELRSRRGMTRRTAALEAGVSERHLAQLETGRGNISILLLQRIATAVGVSLSELFSKEIQEAPEKQRIGRLLERLPAHRITEIASRLMREFGQEKEQRQMRVALIGLRGAGKSTLGFLLAKDREIPFVELDQEIEQDAGMPLSEIFALYGQSGYRAIERRALEKVLRREKRAVISVGGGVVSEKETFDYLLCNCYTVWIKAQPEEHMARVMAQGDFRAMAGNKQAMDDLRQILKSREPQYVKADLILDTSGVSVQESFSKLKAALEENPQ